MSNVFPTDEKGERYSSRATFTGTVLRAFGLVNFAPVFLGIFFLFVGWTHWHWFEFGSGFSNNAVIYHRIWFLALAAAVVFGTVTGIRLLFSPRKRLGIVLAFLWLIIALPSPFAIRLFWAA